MIEITYEYNGTLRTMSYENPKIFLTSQLSCTLDVPHFYTVKKVMVDGVEIEELRQVSQETLYDYFK